MIIFFFIIFLKFVQNLEIKYLFLEKTTSLCYKFISQISLRSFYSFGICLKLENLLLNLVLLSFSNKNCIKYLPKWFYLLVKIIRKKLKILYGTTHIKKKFFNLDTSKFIFKEKSFNSTFIWSSRKYSSFNKNNKDMSWRITKIFFSCILCKKSVAIVNSSKFFGVFNLSQRNLLFLKFPKLTCLSNFSLCTYCLEITKIFKKVVFLFDNISIIENLIFLNKKFIKNFLKNIDKNHKICDNFSNQKKIYYFHWHFFTYVFSKTKKIYLISKLLKLPKRINFQIPFKFLDYLETTNNKKSIKEFKKEIISTFSIMSKLCGRINKYKFIEITFLNSKKENIYNQIKF